MAWSPELLPGDGLSAGGETPSHEVGYSWFVSRPASWIDSVNLLYHPCMDQFLPGGTPPDCHLLLRSLGHVNKAPQGDSPFSPRLGLMSRDSCAPRRTDKPKGRTPRCQVPPAYYTSEVREGLAQVELDGRLQGHKIF